MGDTMVPMTQKEKVEKAALMLSDLSAAGRLNEIQSNTFIKMLQDQPTIINNCRVVKFNGDKKKIEKIGIGTRVLHGAQEGVAIADDKKAKPTFSKVSLSTEEFIAEWEITDDTLENNIEGKSIEDTIMSIFAERVSLDLEELIINGDTTKTSDDLLSVLDGIRKQATSHVVDYGSTAASRLLFKAMLKAMPTKYKRNKKAMKFYVSDDVETEWSDSLASRATSLGDQQILTATVPPAYGVPVQGISMLQEYDDGAGTMVSDALLTHPKNIILGISRDIRIEADRDIRRRVNYVVLTLKVDVKFEEEDAVVKATKIKQDA